MCLISYKITFEKSGVFRFIPKTAGEAQKINHYSPVINHG
jgi:hypothetical protein